MTPSTELADATAGPAFDVRDRSFSEAPRYLVASVVALGVDSALLFAGVALGVPAWLAGAASYLAGLVLIYQLSTRWVFSHREVRDPRKEFAVFAALGLVGLALNSATLHVAASAGVMLPVSKAIAAAIGFVSNFACRKALLFTVAARTAQPS